MKSQKKIPSGVYAIYPDGGCIVLVCIVEGKIVNRTEESCFQSHLQAGDWWAEWIGRLAESEDRDYPLPEIHEAICQLWDADVYPECVVSVKL